MQDYINLINFLKENDESVRKDLETLKFGTIVKYKTPLKWTNPRDYFRYKWEWDWDNEISLPPIRMYNNQAFEIIWNNLDYHHLMIYCDSNKIRLVIQANGVIKTIIWNWWFENESYDIITNIDNTKPFHKQEQKVYKRLLDYFIWLQ